MIVKVQMIVICDIKFLKLILAGLLLSLQEEWMVRD